MRIEAAAWERLVPTENVSVAASPLVQNSRKAAEWGLAGVKLKAGKTRSREIVLVGAAPHADLVFKVLARDKSGNDLAAWAVLRHNPRVGGDGL